MSGGLTELLLRRLHMTCAVHTYLVLHLYTCTQHMCIHVCCVDFYLHAAYSCSESYGIVFMFDPRQPSGQAQGSFPQQQPQPLDWSPSMADFVWKWLKNELPTVLVCLPDGANQGNKVVKHRDPTPHSNRCNRINSHSGLLALIDTSNAKDLSRLYNNGKLVFSVLDSQAFIVLNQCCLQFALKVCYFDLLRHDFVACLEIVAMGVFAIVDLYQHFVTSCDRECQHSWNYRSCSHSNIELDAVDVWRFERICCYAGCVWHVHAYLVLHLYTCSFVHRTCVYMCAVWTFICMLRTHAQRAMALSSCLIQGNQVVKLKVHFHNNNLSCLTEVLAWQILCGNGWRMNYLLCLFACLMVQTKATKWSNTGTLPPTATVATEPTATVACLHWLTNQMLKTWAGCTTKAS